MYDHGFNICTIDTPFQVSKSIPNFVHNGFPYFSTLHRCFEIDGHLVETGSGRAQCIFSSCKAFNFLVVSDKDQPLFQTKTSPLWLHLFTERKHCKGSTFITSLLVQLPQKTSNPIAKVTPTFDKPHVAALVHANFKELDLQCGNFSSLGTKTELYGKRSSILMYNSHYALTFSVVDMSIVLRQFLSENDLIF